ncbi:MAG: EF-hand domain-containing protein [Betaproteobacteria bacterium]|nr:EF-hand domain-containing protein [Betaproteobacteria bacterium]
MNKISYRLLLAAVACTLTSAAAMPPATVERPLQDPYVPKAARDQAAAPVAPSRDAVLREQVESKLRAGFDAAAKMHGGAVTIEQARAAGLGYVVKNFDAIDTRKSGFVRFEDVKAFMRGRGAQLN